MKPFILSLFLLFLPLPLFAAEDAAFPAQELGSKPSILTDTAKLSETELREGWICLVDGVSTFGWTPLEGTFAVRNGLLVNEPAKANAVIRFNGRFTNYTITGERRQTDDSGWTPFSRSAETSNPRQAGTMEIALESGQYRNIKLLPKNMKPLFNGKDLTGWTIYPESKATAGNGEIRLVGGSGCLETAESFDNFVLQLEYRTDKPVNSGVFFRCIPGEKMNGYECQIFNHPPDDDYKKFIGTDTGGIFRRQVGRNAGPKDGEWNYLTIYANDAKIATWVNGIQVTDWTDQRDPHKNPRNGRRVEAGTIQFQGHDSDTDIRFRNIRIGKL